MTENLETVFRRGVDLDLYNPVDPAGSRNYVTVYDRAVAEHAADSLAGRFVSILDGADWRTFQITGNEYFSDSEQGKIFFATAVFANETEDNCTVAAEYDASGLVHKAEIIARAISEDYGHADGQATISARYDAGLAAFVDVATPREVVVEIKAAGVPVFLGVCTGRIARGKSIDYAGPDDLQIEALDFGDALRVPIGAEFIREGYIVAPDDGIDSIAGDLLAASGYTLDLAVYCNDTVPAIYFESTTTVYDALTALLYEYGFGWRACPDGKIRLVDLSNATQTGPDITATNSRSIRTTRPEVIANTVAARWWTQETKTDFPVYVERLPYDSNNKPLGVVVQAGRYYPPEYELDPDEIKQAYTSAAYDYLVRDVERLRKARPQLIYATGCYIDEVTTGLHREIETLGTRSAQIVYHNASGVDGWLVRLAIYGTARLRRAEAVSKAVGIGGTEAVELELSHVSEIAIAERFTALHARRHYPDALLIDAEVIDTVAIQPGQLAEFDTEAGTFLADVLEVSETTESGYKTVRAMARSVAVPAVVIDISPLPGDPITDLETAIGNAITPDNLVDGVNDTTSGATTVPEIPTVTADGGYMSVTVRASVTRYQTGRVRFEAQVADNAAGPWYALGTVTDWKGALGADTDNPVGLFVHSPIPLPVDGDGNATGRTLYYRVRVVTTNASPVGSWSSIVSGTASPVNTGTIAASAIVAGNIEAGVLNALLAIIKESLTIDAEAGYTARVDEDKRVRMDETGLYIDDWTVPAPTAYQNAIPTAQEKNKNVTSLVVASLTGPHPDGFYSGGTAQIYDAGQDEIITLNITGNEAIPEAGGWYILTFVETYIGAVSTGNLFDILMPNAGAWSQVLGISSDPKILFENGLSIGQGAGRDASAIGRYNSANGVQATSCGVGNTADGENAQIFGGWNQASGQNSVATGLLNIVRGATKSSAFGISNTSSGDESSTAGKGNTAGGLRATAVGNGNTASGEDSTAVGKGNTASGQDSVAIGEGNNAQHAYSVAVGVGNRASTGNSAEEHGSYCFGEGNAIDGAGSIAVGKSNTISYANAGCFGELNNASHYLSYCFGRSATSAGVNTLQVGGSGQTLYYYSIAARSDARDKADIEDIPQELGLEFVLAIRPRRYKMNYREDYTDTDGNFDVEAHAAGTKKRGRWHTGFIAQEMKATLDAAGVDISAIKDGNVNAQKDAFAIDYPELIAILAKAIQEQDAQIAALTARVDVLEKTKDKGTE